MSINILIYIHAVSHAFYIIYNLKILRLDGVEGTQFTCHRICHLLQVPNRCCVSTTGGIEEFSANENIRKS